MNCDRHICAAQDYNGGCDTCVCNSKNQSECCYQMEQEVNQILWRYFFEDKFDNDESFDSDIFVIKPYNYAYIGYESNDWNFYHIPSGLKIEWYKYPLRSPMSNMEITHEDFLEVLKDCYNYLMNHNRSPVKTYYDCHKWWEKR